MAPPSKFTKPYRDKLFKNLRLGMPLEPACAGAGIGVRTMTDWRAAGVAAVEKRLNGDKLTVREQALARFGEDLADAVAYGHYTLFMWWHDEAKKPPMKGNWQAAERMLERRFRDDYRIQDRGARVAGKVEAGDVKITFSFEPDQTLVEELREK